MVRSINIALLYFLAFGVAGYAAFVYSMLPLGSLVHPDMQANFLAHSTGIYTHAFAAIVALVLGPFQFSSRLRQKHLQLHRWLGRSYLAVGVLVGGVSGLYMSQFAYGGTVARLGFAALAVFWLYTGLRAFLAIRRRAVDEHRRWMVRNFALTFRLPCSPVSTFQWPIQSSHGYVGYRICCLQSGDTTTLQATQTLRCNCINSIATHFLVGTPGRSEINRVTDIGRKVGHLDVVLIAIDARCRITDGHANVVPPGFQKVAVCQSR
jgi:uncharacterized membrane protein